LFSFNVVVAIGTSISGDGDANNQGAIIGGVIGGILGLLLLIIIVIIVLCRRRRRKYNTTETFVNSRVGWYNKE